MASVKTLLFAKLLAAKGGEESKTTLSVDGESVRAVVPGKVGAASTKAARALLDGREGIVVQGKAQTEDGLTLTVREKHSGAGVSQIFSDYLGIKPSKAKDDAAFDMAAKEGK